MWFLKNIMKTIRTLEQWKDMRLDVSYYEDHSGKHANYFPESFPLVLVTCGRAANIIYPEDFKVKSYKITLKLKNQIQLSIGPPRWVCTLDGKQRFFHYNAPEFMREDIFAFIGSLNMDEIEKVTVS